MVTIKRTAVKYDTVVKVERSLRHCEELFFNLPSDISKLTFTSAGF